MGICKGAYRIRNFDAADGIDFCRGYTVFKFVVVHGRDVYSKARIVLARVRHIVNDIPVFNDCADVKAFFAERGFGTCQSCFAPPLWTGQSW